MRVSSSPDYVIPLPPRHSFPMTKFSILRDLLIQHAIVHPNDIIEPEQAPWNDLGLVHTSEYLRALETGTMAEQAVRRMGFPWSHALVRRSRLAVQGTINACRFALEDGIGGNLAGGTHHAMPDHAQGFCVLNDVAIAVKLLIRSGEISRALIIDLDVHQGNGTAACLADTPSAFTFSMHNAKNFPRLKEQSTRDVPLEDNLNDDRYLSILESELTHLYDRAWKHCRGNPDLVIYLAGVDVLAGDKFGRLALTPQGLAQRDRMTIRSAHSRGLPTALLLSGGYSPTPGDTARNHMTLYAEAAALESPSQTRPQETRA
ncbi:MAG: histone deacetylase [Planctomycetota bacterium]